MVVSLKCKICGGTIDVDSETRIGTCQYCGTKQTLPYLNSEKKIILYERASQYFHSGDFDNAAAIYEQILAEDNTDSETYWSLVLCRYGIEYIEDPKTHKHIPTVNRTQINSIYNDNDYKLAIKYASDEQKILYEQEAKEIENIQKRILEISNKEEPFDIFICYKETDANGRRTQDSVLANELYYQLTQEGFKVFFSRITLEDKLGTAYEPYIYAALNSAKVMIVIGTKPEYFDAVWVKNEWSRYLTLIKNGAKKTLIPAYRDMDPYDLPEEFAYLQSQDMSKLGFTQDLVRGIKKIQSGESVKAAPVKSKKDNENHLDSSATVNEAITENLYSIAEKKMSKKDKNNLSVAVELFKEIPDYKDAKEKASVCQKEINKKSRVGIIAVLALALAIGGCFSYKPIMKKAQEEKEAELLNEKYNEALSLYNDGNYSEAYEAFKSLDYKDSSELRKDSLLKTQKIDITNVGLWKTVNFGVYEQDNDLSNGEEEIVWNILDYEDDRMLIMSDKALDARQYHSTISSVTWETSDIREWLNGEFLEEAFSDSQREKILTTYVSETESTTHWTGSSNVTEDKIFLFSAIEAEYYFASEMERMCVPTDYAIANGAYVNISDTPGVKNTCMWWLRTSGINNSYVLGINSKGKVGSIGLDVYSSYNCIRPLMWVSIK